VFTPFMVVSPVVKGGSGVGDFCNNPLSKWGVSGDSGEKGSNFMFDGSEVEGDGVPVFWLSLPALSTPM